MMLGYLYGSSTDTTFQTKYLSYGQDLALKVATSVGTLVGHLFFGWAADIVGRKHMCTYSPYQSCCVRLSQTQTDTNSPLSQSPPSRRR
jgi:hypothetical protein